MGAEVVAVDMTSEQAIATACTGATCVVSALAGLQDVVIDAQKILLNGAILAGVPRFIPSDYSLDFTKFTDGENRNLDIRRNFHKYLDSTPIAATTIFNGAFMDMLTDEIPMILFKKNLVLYWGDADHKIGFTTVADTAVFTANVALDAATPRYLRIAGDRISPVEIRDVMSELSGKRFRYTPNGRPWITGCTDKNSQTNGTGKDGPLPCLARNAVHEKYDGQTGNGKHHRQRSVRRYEMDNRQRPAIGSKTQLAINRYRVSGVQLLRINVWINQGWTGYYQPGLFRTGFGQPERVLSGRESVCYQDSQWEIGTFNVPPMYGSISPSVPPPGTDRFGEGHFMVTRQSCFSV